MITLNIEERALLLRDENEQTLSAAYQIAQLSYRYKATWVEPDDEFMTGKCDRLQILNEEDMSLI